MPKPTDRELDASVAGMLRIGVSLSALVVMSGGILLLHSAGPTASFRHFDPGDPQLRTLPGLLRGMAMFEPKSVIQFGLIILIATPIARVIFCVVGFARQKDLLYVIISSIVLLVLMYSVLYGGR